MNWQYLKYFEVVAEEQHFTRAAQKLFITTSALSRAIGSLEDELRVQLFAKNGRNVNLTKYGTCFLEYVKQATGTIEEGCKVLDEMANHAHGDVRISTIYTYAATVLPRIIKSFVKDRPNVTFTMYQTTSMQTVSDVLNGNVEFGFASDYIDWNRYPTLDHHKIMSEDIILIVPKDHPWSARQSMRLDEIANEKFISFGYTSSILYHLENIFSAAGYKYQVSMMLSDDYSIASMVRNGMGVALIPAGQKCVSKEDLAVVQLEGAEFKRNIYMLWQRNAFSSFAADCFRNHVINLPDDI